MYDDSSFKGNGQGLYHRRTHFGIRLCTGKRCTRSSGATGDYLAKHFALQATTDIHSGVTGPVGGAASTVKGKLAHGVGGVSDALAVGGDLAGCAGIARGHVHDRVVGEEVARPQQKRDGLHRHHGEVLRGRDVRHAESVPEHYVRVLDRFCPVPDPLRQAHRRLT